MFNKAPIILNLIKPKTIFELLLFIIGLIEFIPINTPCLANAIHFCNSQAISFLVVLIFLVYWSVTRRKMVVVYIIIVSLVMIFRYPIRRACDEIIVSINENREDKIALFAGVQVRVNDDNDSIFSWSCVFGYHDLVHDPNHPYKKIFWREITYVVNEDWYISFMPALE